MVGCAKPGVSAVSKQLLPIPTRAQIQHTLGDLLATVNLSKFLLDELVSLFAKIDDLGTGDAELGHVGQDLLGDLGGRLVLGEGVGVVEGIV